MPIDRVTITGADNSIRPEQLLPLSNEFPFVEWAILLSSTKEDNPRYPTRAWVDELAALAEPNDLKLAGHICGAWVRELVIKKDFGVFRDRPEFLEYFHRIQLNFSPYHAAQTFLDVLPYENEWIFQVGSKGRAEKEALLLLGLSKGMNLAALFDRSGGKGIVPASWPEPINDPMYQGYAGGLGPDTLAEQLPLISEVVGDRTIWIDMESRVRSDDDKRFDLEKVRACLELCQPWVYENK